MRIKTFSILKFKGRKKEVKILSKDVVFPKTTGFKEGEAFVLVALKVSGEKWISSLVTFEKDLLDTLPEKELLGLIMEGLRKVKEFGEERGEST